jgi:hypothetical protein
VVYITLILSILCYLLILQPVQAQVTIDVWTNKGGVGQYNLDGGTYTIGEYVRVCYSLDKDVDRLLVYIVFPDGSMRKIYDGAAKAGGYCDEGVGYYPLGVRKVIAQAWIAGILVGEDTVSYKVVGCPPYGKHVGIKIIVEWKPLDGESKLSLRILGWFSPLGVDWETYKSYCYNPSEHDYIRDQLVKPSLSATSLTEVRRGIDDKSKTVWSEYLTTLDNLAFSDARLWILRISDPLKAAGRGYIDEVRVESYKPIWKATPSPTQSGSNYVQWINPSGQEAPLNYEIYLDEVANIRVRIEGLPEDVNLKLLIDGEVVGVSTAGKTLEYQARGLKHTVSIDPEIIQIARDTRYKCLDCIRNVVGDSITGMAELVVKFVKQFYTVINVEPRLPQLSKILIDGGQHELPFNDWWDEGSKHTISLITANIVTDQKAKERVVYAFEKWLKGGTSSAWFTDHMITVDVSEPIILTAVYSKTRQFLVTASSKYGKVTGDGWYNEGTTAEVSILGLSGEGEELYYIPLDNFSRAVFEGWRGDITSSNPSIRFIVDAAKDITADWKIQYYVRIIDPLEEAKGGGWYDLGSQARISITNPIIYQGGVRWVFLGWEGDCQFQCAVHDIILRVDNPINLVAKWDKQYRVKLTAEPESLKAKVFMEEEKWVSEGGLLIIEVPYEIYESEKDTKYIFKEWAGITSDRRLELRVSNPVTVKAVYDTWYYLKVIDENGLAVGEGWYPKGGEAEVRVQETSTGFLVKKVFNGWEVDGNIISKDRTLKYVVNQPITLRALWTTDYTELIVMIAVLGSIIGATSLFIVKRDLAHNIIQYIIIRKKDKEHVEKLQKLDELYEKGQISREAYMKLKKEYEEEPEN